MQYALPNSTRRMWTKKHEHGRALSTEKTKIYSSFQIAFNWSLTVQSLWLGSCFESKTKSGRRIFEIKLNSGWDVDAANIEQCF